MPRPATARRPTSRSDRPGPTTAARRSAIAFVLGIGSCVGVAIAGPAPAPVRAEIDALMAALRSSGCEFQRNGSWHDAPTAVSHLMRKLEAVEQRTTLTSTERYIELAAARSSVSGSAYQVRCPGAQVTDSATWLTTQLRAIRATRATSSPPAAR